ncbi:hypothetical protein D3C71_1265940 [compost metagenome]
MQLQPLLLAGTYAVQQLGQSMAACARLPLQHEILVGLGQLVELMTQGDDLGAGADQLMLHGRLDLAAPGQYLPPVRHGARQQIQQGLRVQRLLQKIEGPLLDRPDRQGDVPMPGDQDHRDLGIYPLHLGQQIQAIHRRHIDVRHQHAGPLFVEQGQCLLRVGEPPGPVARQVQQMAIGFQYIFVIIHQQHVGGATTGQQHGSHSRASS